MTARDMGRDVTDDDLFEFPADHVGRKSYVSVRGYSRSIPAFKTYRGVDGYNYVLPEYGGTDAGMGDGSAYIMPDKPGYVSPMSRIVVEGRAAHREHMKVHGVMEAGDMKMGWSAGRDNKPMGRAGHDIVRAMQELSR